MDKLSQADQERIVAYFKRIAESLEELNHKFDRLIELKLHIAE